MPLPTRRSCINPGKPTSARLSWVYMVWIPKIVPSNLSNLVQSSGSTDPSDRPSVVTLFRKAEAEVFGFGPVPTVTPVKKVMPRVTERRGSGVGCFRPPPPSCRTLAFVLPIPRFGYAGVHACGDDWISIAASLFPCLAFVETSGGDDLVNFFLFFFSF